MAWTSLASNQTVSFNNLQSAVNIGLFAQNTTIPGSLEQITKSDASTYVQINTGYGPYAAKASNQLVVRNDLQPVWQNSATFYYSGLAVEIYEGWASGSTACSSYTSGGSTTIYWNGSFVPFASIYSPIFFDSADFYIVILSGSPNYVTFVYQEYVASVGLFRYTIVEYTACPTPSYEWTDAKYGTDFFNVCFELSQSVYTSTPTIGVTTIIYTDPGLTTFLGSADYISIPAASSGLIWNISTIGEITGDTGSTC